MDVPERATDSGTTITKQEAGMNGDMPLDDERLRTQPMSQ
jgi:hypothetical protein